MPQYRRALCRIDGMLLLRQILDLPVGTALRGVAFEHGDVVLELVGPQLPVDVPAEGAPIPSVVAVYESYYGVGGSKVTRFKEWKAV